VEEKVPSFLYNKGQGWVTAEYAMLPRATLTRNNRERREVSGRSQEIQRLIGRSLRSVIDMTKLGDRTFTVDCDVLQADGGTRTASITGAYVALYQAFQTLVNMGVMSAMPFKAAVAATSVGVVRNTMMLDLCYDEDSTAEVDFNVVMTSIGTFVELQGTAENKPFTRETMDSLIKLGEKGIKQLFEAQQTAITALKAGR